MSDMIRMMNDMPQKKYFSRNLNSYIVNIEHILYIQIEAQFFIKLKAVKYKNKENDTKIFLMKIRFNAPTLCFVFST